MKETFSDQMGDKGRRLKSDAEGGILFGFSVKEMSRDELLIVIGYLAQAHQFERDRAIAQHERLFELLKQTRC